MSLPPPSAIPVPLPPPTTAPTERTRSRQSLSAGPSSSPSGDRDLSKGDEIGMLRHQLRLSRAEVLQLQEKLGIKQNPAPFGSTFRRASETSASLGLPQPRQSNARASSPFDSPTTINEGSSRPSSPLIGTGPVPGAVSFTKALLSENGSPILDSESFDPVDGEPPRASNGRTERSDSGSGAVSRSSPAAGNPFFGSGASRERLSKSAASAASGSGKVISGLQSELLARSSALDTARQQLRNSQKAVEVLSRQNDDLKDAKERLSADYEGLNKMISRKERLTEEAVGRANVAESALSTLQAKHQEALSAHKNRIKEMEESTLLAEEARAKAESEHQALRLGMKSMAEGWKAELDWLKADLVKLEAKHQRELDETKLKHSTLTKLFKAKEAEHGNVKATINKMQMSLKQTEKTIEELKEQFAGRLQVAANEDESLKRCLQLETEFQRLRRLMREHS
ncbi:hypothetical protein T439DRAFT_324444 [Meredithblackwellia eburnea MCA 4105]